jgi:hypothetical protein
LVSLAKNPAKVRAGRIGSRTRWGPPRILRLDTLDPVTRQIIGAILTARENAKAAPDALPSGTE